MTSRRGFLATLAAFLALPSVVKAAGREAKPIRAELVPTLTADARNELMRRQMFWQNGPRKPVNNAMFEYNDGTWSVVR